MKPIVEINCKVQDWPLVTEFGPEQPIAPIIILLRNYFNVPENKKVQLFYGKKQLKPENVLKRWKDYNIKMKKTKLKIGKPSIDSPAKLELVVI